MSRESENISAFIQGRQDSQHQFEKDMVKVAAAGVVGAAFGQQFPRATRILGWLAVLLIVGGFASYLVARYMIYKY